MFENLTNQFSRILRNISDRGRLTENNIKETLKKVREALLEADVALPVVYDFISRVKDKAIDHKINKSLTPGQEFIKIVRKELILIMGQEDQILNLSSPPPIVMLVVGLQGVGKTTNVGKLGKLLREKNKKKVLIVSIDIYRPAAVKQLELLSHQAKVDFFPSYDPGQDPINIIKAALKVAKIKFYDVLLIDTAGFLHSNDMMMGKIKQIIALIKPVEILLFVDAMAGQDAVNTAKVFNESLPLTSIVLTKVDSDTRGGAALSARYITGKPIKFLSTGEEIEDLEPFRPERVASRILGMGDVLSLIEDIEGKINFKRKNNLITKMRKGRDFDLKDFLEQLHHIKDMGGIMSFMSKIPGMRKVSNSIQQAQINSLIKMEAIINSMTLKERANPDIIKGSRKRRIAEGCGMQVQDVNQLIKHFNNIQYLMKKINKGDLTKIIHNIR